MNPSQEKWYVRNAGKAVGPISENELREALRGGQVSPNDLVWSEDVRIWQAAREWPEFHQGPWPDEQMRGMLNDDAKVWVVLKNPELLKEMTGPWTLRQIRTEISEGRMRETDLLWTSGMTGWVTMKDRPEVWEVK